VRRSWSKHRRSTTGQASTLTHPRARQRFKQVAAWMQCDSLAIKKWNKWTTTAAAVTSGRELVARHPIPPRVLSSFLTLDPLRRSRRPPSTPSTVCLALDHPNKQFTQPVGPCVILV
jgi:hypothetical protein